MRTRFDYMRIRKDRTENYPFLLVCSMADAQAQLEEWHELIY